MTCDVLLALADRHLQTCQLYHGNKFGVRATKESCTAVYSCSVLGVTIMDNLEPGGIPASGSQRQTGGAEGSDPRGPAMSQPRLTLTSDGRLR